MTYDVGDDQRHGRHLRQLFGSPPRTRPKLSDCTVAVHVMADADVPTLRGVGIFACRRYASFTRINEDYRYIERVEYYV